MARLLGPEEGKNEPQADSRQVATAPAETDMIRKSNIKATALLPKSHSYKQISYHKLNVHRGFRGLPLRAAGKDAGLPKRFEGSPWLAWPAGIFAKSLISLAELSLKIC
jgi:hypothetical protein